MFSPQRRVNHGSCKAEMLLVVIVMLYHPQIDETTIKPNQKCRIALFLFTGTQ